MLLHNVFRHKVPSALVGQPTLDNVYTTKKKKKAGVAKVGIGPYGGLYSLVNSDCDGDNDGDSDGGDSDGGDGGGGE